MTYNHKIHFTLEEARNLIPQVVPKLEAIRELKTSLEEKGFDIRGYQILISKGTNGTQAHPDETKPLVENVKDLTSKGILLKDLERGLIDFPAIRSNGDEVYLCFMLGEETINYWHEIDAGYVGRQRVDEL